MRVAVLGGGPGGLVTLKYLVTAHQFFPDIEPIEARLFEAEAEIGGTFRYRTYEDAELVSSRQLTGFSDFRVPDNAPDFLKTTKYCEYLERYCTHFGLWPSIKTSTRVKSIQRAETSGHIISYSTLGSTEAEEWTCDAIAVCSGLHVTPDVPSIPGIKNVPKTMHSSEFKQKAQFGIDQDIMILGSGETAMDLGYLAVTSPTRSVTICHRSGWQNAPKVSPDPIIRGDMKTWNETNAKYGPNVPVDVSSSSLFDTAYVHPQLEKSILLWDYYDRFVKYSDWLVTGTTAGLDQWVGGIPPDRYHASKFIPNKSNKAMPYISKPYRPKVKSTIEDTRSRLFALHPDLVETHGRQIDLAPFPSHIDENGIVHFQATGRPEAERMKNVICKPDILILATGYTQVYPFLGSSSSYPRPETCNARRIWSTTDPSIGFIGFVRPNFGAIPPLAEMQAQLWIANLLHALPKPIDTTQTDYRLRTPADRRIQYGVDHESYAYQLALDMGSAPGISLVLRHGWKVSLTWALSVNFNTKFRLCGPWRDAGPAADLMRGELWRTVTRRRGPFAWILLTFLPIFLFGALSLWCYLFFGVCDVLLWPGRGFVSVLVGVGEMVGLKGKTRARARASTGVDLRGKGKEGLLSGRVDG